MKVISQPLARGKDLDRGRGARDFQRSEGEVGGEPADRFQNNGS
jgi:hypothetical protein